jgi:DNA ligase-1
MKWLFFLFLPLFLYASKPELLLLKTYDENAQVDGWLMSEKLDGIRAYWDGKKLLSRNGKEFAVPSWFMQNFPPFAIDGELWSKRGDFEHISSITSKKEPHDGWRELTYNIFEVPHQSGGLLHRLEVLREYLTKNPTPYINIIQQLTCKDSQDLKNYLQEIESKGGEGVVVRNPEALYIAQRTENALKVKSFEDTECEVLGYKKGEGKFEDKVGSIKCKLEDGKILYIGSGLSDAKRTNPPKIGSVITFRYQGLTKAGFPRFPVYLRVREEGR